MNVVRYADRSYLLERRYEELTKPTFPEYMNSNEPGRRFWERLYSDFPDFQASEPTSNRMSGCYTASSCPAYT
ncbi:MAG: hypothetical protein OEW52_00755, partial [Thermoleophilia bacterium]|nr:hypothetical protein [Thermoleophilia bacterium]